MTKNLLLTTILACMATLSTQSQNPIICDRYTPDPAPYVHGDTLYLFVDHDENETLNGYFTMKDWLLYSTVDMVNWTYRGTPLTSATFSKLHSLLPEYVLRIRVHCWYASTRRQAQALS